MQGMELQCRSYQKHPTPGLKTKGRGEVTEVVGTLVVIVVTIMQPPRLVRLLNRSERVLDLLKLGCGIGARVLVWMILQRQPAVRLPRLLERGVRAEP